MEAREGRPKLFRGGGGGGGSVSTQGQCGPVVPFPEYTQLSHAASKHTFLREEQIHELSPNGSIFFFFFSAWFQKDHFGRRYTHRCHQAQVPPVENRRNEKKPM